jgi:hypothetical protein
MGSTDRPTEMAFGRWGRLRAMTVSRLRVARSETRDLGERARVHLARVQRGDGLTEWVLGNATFFTAFVAILAVLAVIR